MPGYKVHIVAGVIAFGCLLSLISKNSSPTCNELLLWFCLTVLGSLFPDIDTKSKGQGIFYKGMLIALIWAFWKRQVYLFVCISFISFVPILARHRGIFHNIWFVTVLPCLLALSLAPVFCMKSSALLLNGAFFSVGALSHILLDRFTTRFF